jgi:hypothetical protein
MRRFPSLVGYFSPVGRKITYLGLTQLPHAASQRHIFACGSKVNTNLLVCSFSALRAEKPHTLEQ